MHPLRRSKLIRIILILSTLMLICGLVLYALRQNISLFYTPTQITQNEAPENHMIRLGGMVVEKSIQRYGNLRVSFKITDYNSTIAVTYQGVLPDLFKEGKGVVVQGKLSDNHHFTATTVLAKHDENYMPPEVKQSLVRKKT